MVTRTYNPGEIEAGRSLKIEGQCGLPNETESQKTIKQTKTNLKISQNIEVAFC